MLRVMEMTAPDAALAEVQGEEAAARVCRPGPGVLRWVDITGQTPADLDLLARGFGFHPLALEDCLHFDQRPKMEEYLTGEPHVFIVIHNFRELTNGAGPPIDDDTSLLVPTAARFAVGEGHFSIEPLELHAFLGSGYLVTVHEQTIEPLDAIWRRVLGEPALLARGCDFVYYLLADALCDSNFPVLEHLADLLDEVEEAVLSRPAKEHLTRIYEMRKVLVSMRRVLSPQRDILALLSRRAGGPCISPQTAPYFRDVHDHLMRINEGVESGRDLLGNCVDAYLSVVGQRTNEIMKRLTILSAVMLPLTFISGFFGMNFEMLPFKSTPLLIGTLVAMFLVIPGGMIFWFRLKRWV